MMVVEVILLIFVQYSTSYLIMPATPHMQYQHSIICPTYPFCYQDTAGVWKSIPDARPRFQPFLQRDVDVESSDCWMNGYFCRSDASNLIETAESESAEDCQEKCKDEEGCKHFSFHITRGQGQCSLLSSCQVITECLDVANCVAGRKTCDCPALDYLPGTKDSTEYARWSCGDIDPYSSSIPVGTTCSVSCASWAESPLESTCLKNGKWSPTVSPARRSLTYLAPYPTPDQPDMVCGCEEVGPFKYNPNDEEGAEFVCQGWEPQRYDKEDGWTIKNSDHCELFCSNEPQPIATVACQGNTWEGQPEIGFWCYQKPENAEPQEQDIEPVPIGCSKNAQLISQAPPVEGLESSSMVLCDDPTDSICEEDLQTICPGGFHLCTTLEFNALNNNWDLKINEKQKPVGEIFCRSNRGAGHFSLKPTHRNLIHLSSDLDKNNIHGSSRPSCTSSYGCNEKWLSALCCSNPTCGDGVVQAPLEECEDGNKSDDDDCLNSCSYRFV